jgi:predicted SprT family Zn-dependent metalloprotease
VRRTIQLSVSLACLVIIGAGARYAYGREQLRRMDPHEVYQETNRDSFQSALPDVRVTWADLDGERYGTTRFYEDGSAAIEVDKGSVLSEGMLREVVEHETCHIAVGSGEAHGEKWQTCMRRFE